MYSTKVPYQSTLKPKHKVGNRAKLSVQEVRLARQMEKRGYTQEMIASHFKVSQPAVCNLLAGRTYKNV